ncbi:MAG: tetratricopeptide repeat protein [Casimicrobiaceae bacterium]
MTPSAAPLEKLLAAGKDSALLRFGLGSAYLGSGDALRAIEHLRHAVRMNPGYSAAWKLLGKSLVAAGSNEEALIAYHEGIAAAERSGDKQAMKEMQVYARRVAKVLGQQ